MTGGQGLTALALVALMLGIVWLRPDVIPDAVVVGAWFAATVALATVVAR